IRANGGTVILTAQAANDIATATVNNTGIIEAQSLTNKNGTILLLADMQTGTVNVGGSLDASAPNGGHGGFVETSAAHVKVADGVRVTTKAENGHTGTWLIDPVDFTIAETGGDITGAVLSTQLGSNNIIIDSVNGSAGTNGDVNVRDAITWGADHTLMLNAFRNININAPITATGTNAGLVLNYGNYAATSSTDAGTDYYVNAPVTLSGSAATLSINGNAYTLIHNMTDFANINSNLGGFYVLGNDIVSSGTYSSALVGNFTGEFAGFGHTISDLNINSSGSYLGLFSENFGTIRNIGILNGNIQSTGVMVGGLVGKNTGTIRDSFYAGVVYVPGGNGAGGLTAWNNGGTIKDSYSTGSVTGNDAVGGIAGYNESSGVINRTYSTATVASLNAGRVGGIIGANNSGTVSDSYATNSIVGGSDGTVSGGGVLDANQMKIASNFSGWDIATTGGSNSKWRIYEENSTPLLRAFLRKLTVTANSGTRDYDGTTNGFGVTYSATPDATLLGAATTTLSSKNVGERTVSVGGLYSNQQGYDIQTKTNTATIDQKTVSIQNVNVADKTYDGTRNATITALNVNGYVGGDDVTTTADASFDTKNVGTNKNVRVSGITVAGADGSNYWMATEFLDTTASITAVIIPPSVANNPTYDTSARQGVLQSGVGARFGEQPVLPGSSGTHAPIQHIALNTDAGNKTRQGQAITERIAGLGCVVQMPEDAAIESCAVMSRAQ
ncbi:MAG: YDG domain-containing protein, partial [Methylotenera sp.]|nr:YDG domain-containing protein [Methylotenera sp.]